MAAGAIAEGMIQLAYLTSRSLLNQTPSWTIAKRPTISGIFSCLQLLPAQKEVRWKALSSWGR